MRIINQDNAVVNLIHLCIFREENNTTDCSTDRPCKSLVPVCFARPPAFRCRSIVEGVSQREETMNGAKGRKRGLRRTSPLHVSPAYRPFSPSRVSEGFFAGEVSNRRVSLQLRGTKCCISVRIASDL